MSSNGRTTEPALPVPPGWKHQADWQERIEAAKKAREVAKRLRAGRPVTFVTRRSDRAGR